jgi:hypothetical protein
MGKVGRCGWTEMRKLRRRRKAGVVVVVLDDRGLRVVLLPIANSSLDRRRAAGSIAAGTEDVGRSGDGEDDHGEDETCS